jgi:N-acetylmuramic acid 6-phosphate etherase
MLTGSVKERRHASTMNIDRLFTLDMLNVIHQDDAQISDAITPFLNTIARVVDNAAATLSHGGRLVIVGAGRRDAWPNKRRQNLRLENIQSSA